MKANLVTVLSIIVLVIVFTFTSPATLPMNADVALAQQSQVVQDQSKEVIKTSTPDPTPKQFEPLLGKWKYDDPRFLTKFEIKNVENGEAKDIGFTVGGRSVDTNAKISEEKGVVRVKIPLQQGTWELTYYPTFGGMLDGSLRLSSGGTINGKFYREK